MADSKIKITSQNHFYSEVFDERETYKNVGMNAAGEVHASELTETEGHVVAFQQGGKVVADSLNESELSVR